MARLHCLDENRRVAWLIARAAQTASRNAGEVQRQSRRFIWNESKSHPRRHSYIGNRPRRLWLCDERMAAQHEAEQKLVSGHLKTSMTSTTMCSRREMVELHRSHSNNVIVTGRRTHDPGLDKYIEDLKAMFVWRLTPGSRSTL